MDRRHFIKLTAITGTTAALTACGNPENQIIRFIPEDDLVPGVATYKPSICPLCAAGCGVIARVMEGDAEVFRNGQAGVIRMGARQEARRQSRGRDQPGQAVRARPGGDSDYLPPGSTGQAEEAIGRAGQRPVCRHHVGRGDQGAHRQAERAGGGQRPGVAGVSGQAASQPAHGPGWRNCCSAFGAKPPVTYEFFSDDVLRRANAAAFGAHQVRDGGPRERALRDVLWRRLPRHLEFVGRPERGLRQDAPGRARALERSSCTLMRA